MKESFSDWIKRILSSDKDASFGRAGAATIIYFLLAWTTYIVIKSAAIPDVPLQWAGLVVFLYLGGKGIQYFSDKSVKPEVSTMTTTTTETKGVTNVGNLDGNMGQ